MFEKLTGNPQIKEYLKRILERRYVGNSLLFAGPDGVGKGLFAREFGKEVLCLDDPQGGHRSKIEKGVHPDLHVYKPEGKTGMHSIDAMRQFSAEVNMPPLEAKRKVFIILDAERMLPYSSNALLKTFEEPTPDSLIILVSSRPSALLSTILSRCRKLYFHALSVEEICRVLQQEGIASQSAEEIAPIAQGSISQALRLLKPEFSNRRSKLLRVLSQGRMADYKEVSEYAQEIAEEIGSANEQWAAALKEEWRKGFSDKPTAVQQQSIEKEIEGAVAMREKSEAQSLFEVILSWFRDVEVLATGGSCERLINREFTEALLQYRQRGALCTLNEAYASIKDTQTSLERSTGLAICLENLFLRLNLL